MHFWFCTNSSCKLHQNVFAFYHSIALYVAQFMGNLRHFQKYFWGITNINLIGSVIIMAAFYKYWISFMERIINQNEPTISFNPHKTVFFILSSSMSPPFFVSPGAISARQNENIHQYFYFKYNNDEIPWVFYLDQGV